jgi:hypothetical protein
MFSTLIVVHVLLVMAGYVGLIATNAWLLALCRTGDAGTIAAAVRAWRTLARVFGPLLGLGVLAGFALAGVMRMPLTALWLVVTYALIIVALGAQASIMVPWQLRAERIAGNGGALPTAPIVAILSVLTVAYICIAALMLLRPT